MKRKFSVSDVELWLSCPQKYYYANIHPCAVPPPSPAMLAGTMFHENLAARSNGETPPHDLYALSSTDEPGWPYLCELSHTVELEQPTPPNRADAEIAYSMDLNQLRLWSSSPDVGRPSPFFDTILVVGRVDRIVWENPGQCWLHQYKTMAWNGSEEALIEKARIGLHENIYQVMVQHATILDSVLGTKLHIARKPQRGKTRPLEFSTHEIVRNITNQTVAVDTMIGAITRMIEDSPIRNTTSCITHYGGKCGYFRACHNNVPVSDLPLVANLDRYKEILE